MKTRCRANSCKSSKLYLGQLTELHPVKRLAQAVSVLSSDFRPSSLYYFSLLVYCNVFLLLVRSPFPCTRFELGYFESSPHNCTRDTRADYFDLQQCFSYLGSPSLYFMLLHTKVSSLYLSIQLYSEQRFRILNFRLIVFLNFFKT